MGEGLVGFGHAVGILFLLIGSAFVVIGSHHLGSKFLGHAVAGTFACKQNEVFHAHADFAVRPYLEGYLECGTAYPAAFYLDMRSDIVKSLLPDLQGRLLSALHLVTHYIKRVVKNPEGNGLFTTEHQIIDEPGNIRIVEFRVR